jgi:hypothetical protein
LPGGDFCPALLFSGLVKLQISTGIIDVLEKSRHSRSSGIVSPHNALKKMIPSNKSGQTPKLE